MITLTVNGSPRRITADPNTPLIYILRNDLQLKGTKLGCGLEQCNSCKVLIDGVDVPSCQLPIKQADGLEVTTVEGLGSAENLHPLQEAFIEEQALQCGYCTASMLIAAQGLLNRVRYPTDEQINTALAGNLCRCGVHERVRRAIKMRIGQPIWDPIYAVQEVAPVAQVAKSAELPRSIQSNPDLDRWIRIDPDRTITIFSGKVEIGQGIGTAVAQITAEELDVALDKICLGVMATDHSPDEGLTAGSMSVEMSGNALRVAAAEARHYLLSLAHEVLEAEVAAEALIVEDGVVRDPVSGRETDYWALMGGRKFGRKITGHALPKSPVDYNLIGQPAKRLDLLKKVTGHPAFVHDLELPNMLHGRVVRHRSHHAELVDFDRATVEQMVGVVAVVCDGNFLGVVAEQEAQAAAAQQALLANAEWRVTTQLPPQETLGALMRSQPATSHSIVGGMPQRDSIRPIVAPKDAVQTIQATYARPYHMHGSLAPSAAVAQWDGDQLRVYSHSQGVFRLRASIATTLGISAENITITHAESSGCYGHNGAEDAAFDAVLLARAVNGRPVLLKWTRADEHGWEPYGSAMQMACQASLDAAGNIIDWNYDVWSYPHLTRPAPDAERSGFVGAWQMADAKLPPTPKAFMWPEVGGHRNATPLYDFPQRIVRHFLPASPLRVSALRTLGAYANIVAIESFMDELAHAANADPVEFRLRHMRNERARAVIEAAAEKAEWQSRSRPNANGTGRGIAFGQYKNKQCYVAVVVDVTVAGEGVRVKKVTIAADAGQIVNPDGLSNQLEGGAIQAISWTLFEQVGWDVDGVTSLDWDSYPILRFPDAPKVEVVLLNRPNQPFLGVGEASQGPAGAALVNAIFDATGERKRALPLS